VPLRTTLVLGPTLEIVESKAKKFTIFAGHSTYMKIVKRLNFAMFAIALRMEDWTYGVLMDLLTKNPVPLNSTCNLLNIRLICCDWTPLDEQMSASNLEQNKYR
jgi:uncharacterized protein (DUF1015 family)